MTFNDFLERLPEITRDLTKEDLRAVRGFLSSDHIIAALAVVALERSQIATALIGGDMSEMTSDQALYAMGRAQGRALGIQRAIEILFELADKLDEEEEEENGD